MSRSHATTPSQRSSVRERQAPLAALRELVQRVRLQSSAGDALYWDERVAMPRAGGAWRAAQRSALAQLVHDSLAGEDMRRALAAAEDAHPGHPEIAALRRDHERARCLPAQFSAEHAAAVSTARAAWDRAREHDDFAGFEPHLSEVLSFAQRSAEYVGYAREPYDAMLEEWEPGADAAWVASTFATLAAELGPMLAARPRCTRELTLRPVPEGARRAFEREVLEAVGFDFGRGVITDSPRAFCIGLGPDDVRMTTRFHGTPGVMGLHSSLHEAGHGIYAQSFARLGVPAALAQAPGLGIDESQSRLVENMVGRSHAFCEWVLGRLLEHFPGVFSEGDLAQLYAEYNTAEHPCRRLGTDELSYSLHITVRFALERALVNGTLAVQDLPEAWADAMDHQLGVRPQRHVDGCLQDVHWSLGQWGYFPTYALGNIYGAQLMEQATAAAGPIEPGLRRSGEWTAHREWFDEHVYRHGRTWNGRELVERASGSPVSVAPFVRYLRAKFVTNAADFARR